MCTVVHSRASWCPYGKCRPIGTLEDVRTSLFVYNLEIMTPIDVDQQHTHQIGDAFRKVHDLVNIPLSEDVPTIQAANFSVLYQVCVT